MRTSLTWGRRYRSWQSKQTISDCPSFWWSVWWFCRLLWRICLWWVGRGRWFLGLMRVGWWRWFGWWVRGRCCRGRMWRRPVWRSLWVRPDFPTLSRSWEILWANKYYYSVGWILPPSCTIGSYKATVRLNRLIHKRAGFCPNAWKCS